MPEGWLEALAGLSLQQLNCLPAGAGLPADQTRLPPSLASFNALAQRFSLSSKPVQLDAAADVSPQLTAALSTGVSAKKQHEARPSLTCAPCHTCALLPAGGAVSELLRAF